MSKWTLYLHPISGLLAWPELWTLRYFNGNNEPCDMLVGPCACGAWHHAEEWGDPRHVCARRLSNTSMILEYYDAEIVPFPADASRELRIKVLGEQEVLAEEAAARRQTLTFQELVTEELVRARNGHGPVRGLHEGYGVLMEEVDEFWDEVKLKKPKREDVLAELVQVAAMAQKIAEDVLLCPSSS